MVGEQFWLNGKISDKEITISPYPSGKALSPRVAISLAVNRISLPVGNFRKNRGFKHTQRGAFGFSFSPNQPHPTIHTISGKNRALFCILPTCIHNFKHNIPAILRVSKNSALVCHSLIINPFTGSRFVMCFHTLDFRFFQA